MTSLRIRSKSNALKALSPSTRPARWSPDSRPTPGPSAAAAPGSAVFDDEYAGRAGLTHVWALGVTGTTRGNSAVRSTLTPAPPFGSWRACCEARVPGPGSSARRDQRRIAVRSSSPELQEPALIVLSGNGFRAESPDKLTQVGSRRRGSRRGRNLPHRGELRPHHVKQARRGSAGTGGRTRGEGWWRARPQDGIGGEADR